jgi:hypothetical protein
LISIAMAVSPGSSKLGSAKLGATKLYRTACWAVILAGLALILARTASAQSAAGKKTIKGPRALGLVELAPGGKAHLVPITILYDGEYYDATAYKAAPVPMALESGTVYEGFRSGVSLGLFTVGSVLQGNNTWVGNGTWQSDAEIAAKKDAAAKRKAVMSKPAPELPEGPPVLRRASPKPKAPDDASSSSGPAGAGPASPSASTPASGTAPAASSPADTPAQTEDSNRPVLKRPAAASPQASSSPPPEAEGDSDRPVLKRPAATAEPADTASIAHASPASPPSSPEPEEDPNRPVLKRGAPTPAELKKRNAATSSPPSPSPAAPKVAPKPSASPSAAASSPLQLIPAISDANGPEPRPYTYNVKPEEEQKLRTKILALAADEVRAWAAQPESAGSQKTPRPASKAKPPQPTFEDVQLHVFDLSNSNEPVLVLTAKARMPVRPNTTSDVQYIITLVARDDIYGDLHKAFASVTDSQHFDVLSRLELIDAVDADGDGRGELLFRQVSDSGSAFVLYRVIGDRLWPLFQGTPQ